MSQTAHVDTRYFTVTCHASFEVYIYMYLSTWFINHVLPVVCLVTVISPNLVFFCCFQCNLYDRNAHEHNQSQYERSHVWLHLLSRRVNLLFNIPAFDLQDTSMYCLVSYRLTYQWVKGVYIQETWQFVQFVSSNKYRNSNLSDLWRGIHIQRNLLTPKHF